MKMVNNLETTKGEYIPAQAVSKNSIACEESNTKADANFNVDNVIKMLISPQARNIGVTNK